MFVMMIIIYINELKNISLSLFKIYYIVNVSDINIKKNCNDIYCEAETARFKLADNSYNLISSNDIFNTKTYYYMVMILIILIYLNLFYNLIEYNNIFYPLINNIDGNIIVNIIKFIPYILSFITLIAVLFTIILRYVPYDKEGYINYFNFNNSYLKEINTLNINSTYLYVILPIISLGLIYIILSIQFAEILHYPDENYTKGKKYKYLCVGYIIIIIMFTYLILNIINIVLSFTENNYPKLNDNVINVISNNLDNKIELLSAKYNSRNIVKECYSSAATGYTYDKENNVIKIPATDLLYDPIKNEYGYLAIFDRNIIKGHIEKIEKNILFPSDTTEYNIYYDAIKINKEYKAGNRYDPINILNNLTLGDFQTSAKYNDFFEKLTTHIRDESKANTLLKIIICFIINELKHFYKEMSDINDDITNKEKNNYYIKHTKLLDIADYTNRIIIYPGDIKDNELTTLKTKITDYCTYNVQFGVVKKDELFFGIEYEPFSTQNESINNYSADFSYNSENTFYEKYFNVLQNSEISGYYDLEYNIGPYYIKNIKTLIYYILAIFGVGILCIIFFYIPNVELIYKYTYEIILPIILLLLFIIYILIFINFNTDYNSNVIYGVLNSSYKRDLNDMNNMIIPIIDKSVNTEPYNNKETGRYLELYIITNVFMSLIYYSDLPLLDKYNITLYDKDTEESKNRLDSKEYDYINFGNDYHELGNLIYDKYYDKTNKLKSNSDKSYSDAILYDFIDKRLSNSSIVEDCTNFINNPTGDTAKTNLQNFITKFVFANNDYKNRLIYKIKKLIKFFKQYDIKNKIMNNFTNDNFFRDRVFFYNNSDGKVLWNKFILKKSFFDNNILVDTNYKRIFGEFKAETPNYIDSMVDNYFNILLHYYFNKLLSVNLEKKDAIIAAISHNEQYMSDNTQLKEHINNYRNNRLFRLLLLQKQKTRTTTINIDMDDTFRNINIDETKTDKPNNDKINGFIKNIITDAIINYNYNNKDNKDISPRQNPMKLNLMYHKLIQKKDKNIKDDTSNALMNIIKNIYYQINKKKIEYYTLDEDKKEEKPIISIMKKLDSDSPENIKNKADNVISYELFITYFINLIIIIIIFNIAISNNKIL
jgi:hypothetical protein